MVRQKFAKLPFVGSIPTSASNFFRAPLKWVSSWKSLALANGRVNELADRYAAPLLELTTRIAGFETKLAAHLAKMGRY